MYLRFNQNGERATVLIKSAWIEGWYTYSYVWQCLDLFISNILGVFLPSAVTNGPVSILKEHASKAQAVSRRLLLLGYLRNSQKQLLLWCGTLKCQVLSATSNSMLTDYHMLDGIAPKKEWTEVPMITHGEMIFKFIKRY